MCADHPHSSPTIKVVVLCDKYPIHLQLKSIVSYVGIQAIRFHHRWVVRISSFLAFVVLRIISFFFCASITSCRPGVILACVCRPCTQLRRQAHRGVYLTCCATASSLSGAGLRSLTRSSSNYSRAQVRATSSVLMPNLWYLACPRVVYEVLP